MCLGEDCFERSTDFIPERWYSRPDMVRNKAAYSPFGTGKTHSVTHRSDPSFSQRKLANNSCVGKFLAMDVMRLVTARLMKKYRIHPALGVENNRVKEDLKDHFTSKPGRLRVMFEMRCNWNIAWMQSVPELAIQSSFFLGNVNDILTPSRMGISSQVE